MRGGVRRFACTQCGKCCNRSPEVELSEAGALADVFVFRLMFRLYRLPRHFQRGGAAFDRADTFYQKKRLLAAHAARKYSRKLMRDGCPVEYTHYLMVSALAVDSRSPACAALSAGQCSIYQRRPLACRTVPFHYARADASAEIDFDAFVASPGYACDTGQDAPVVIEGGRMVDGSTVNARREALAVAESDRAWKEAIVRRMKANSCADDSLPSIDDIEANAAFAAMTTSMRVGWQIASDSGLITPDECRRLTEEQLNVIERELGHAQSSAEDTQTLQEMHAEYRLALLAPAARY
jgi:Fe-S-cluster containining protein